VTRLPGDVILLPAAQGRWIVMNVFARTCLGLEADGVAVLSDIESLAPGALLERHSGSFAVYEIEWFSNVEGLLADPTRIRRGSWPEAEKVDAPGLVQRLKKHRLLVDDETAYRASFAPKTSLVDGVRLGNFHQQLGRELLLVRRENPSSWWVRQKFASPEKLNDNLYEAVQGNFLRRYFPERFASGKRVLDLGCGTGFYAKLMAHAGARVVAVDPSAEYIEIARTSQRSQSPSDRSATDVRFEVAALGEPGALAALADESFDFVFMSDAILFYFVSPAPGPKPDLGVLLADVKRVLEPNGRFISIEPHSTFWLAPWLGDADHPFTVLTEHLDRTFGVTAPLGRFLESILEHGFSLTRIEELGVDPGFATVDPRAYHFARQFPLWQFCEFAKAG